MPKGARHATQYYLKRVRRKPEVIPPEISTPLSQQEITKQQAEETCLGLLHQIEGIFASLPVSILVCDRAGKILRVNAAALKLFDVPSESRWQGRPFQEFFQHYQLRSEQQHPISPESWLTPPDEAATPDERGQMIILGTPSGRETCLHLLSSPLLDEQLQSIGTIFVFHKVSSFYRKALHLQHVHEAVQALNTAITQIPEHIHFTLPETMLLLSPPVLFVAQQLVDVVRQVLDCWRVSLITVESYAYSYHYVVGSGFTPEEEQHRRNLRGRFVYPDFVDWEVYERLHANQEVILSTDHMRIPQGFPDDIGAANLLLIPLFLEQQLHGALIIFKAGRDSSYTQEEIDLVKAVAAQAVLVVQCLSCLCEQAGEQARALTLHEINRLSNEFLTLASHELRTPLTGIMGNLQLAQRRLETLKRQVKEQSSQVRERIMQAQEPLASAVESARLQERMIQDMVDDARIQADTLTLYLKHNNLLTLLRAARARLQPSAPEHPIVLEIPPLPDDDTIPIIVDAERINQVLDIYLVNALAHSPAEQPVTVQVRIEDAIVRISVHDEGPGIPIEEQARLWERFYRGKGSAIQHELDLSLGLSFYLCQALIERHHGHVGVESDLHHGTTFWFTLPIVRSEQKPV
ncbi:MAG: PAS domain-containing sensor histidine kinase [Ktedonobacteraceae bacterium]|nr:PAS domain-containing sensor histidine kinase [Ktedonobacteraceae bacterium]